MSGASQRPSSQVAGGGKKKKGGAANPTPGTAPALDSLILAEDDVRRPQYNHIVANLKTTYDPTNSVGIREIELAMWSKSVPTVAALDERIRRLCEAALQKEHADAAKSILNRWTRVLRLMTYENKEAKDAWSIADNECAEDAADEARTDSESEEEEEDEDATAARASGKKSTGAAKRPSKASKSSGASSNSWTPILQQLFKALRSKLSRPSLDLFEYPVPKADFPDYYKFIKQPMCLDDIDTNLKKNMYEKTPDVFLTHVGLIWENCMSYNDEKSEPHNLAVSNQKLWNQILDGSKELKTMEKARKAGTPMEIPPLPSTPAAAPAVAAASAPSSESKKKKAAAAAPVPPPAAAATTAPPAPSAVIISGPFEANRGRQLLTKLQKYDARVKEWFWSDPRTLAQYTTVIKKPMWFGQIEQKLAKGSYSSPSQFQDDVELIWKNCFEYNGPASPANVFSQTAAKLQHHFRKIFTEEFSKPAAAAAPQTEIERKLAELQAQAKLLEEELANKQKAAAAAATAAPAVHTAPVVAPPPAAAVPTPTPAPLPPPKPAATPIVAAPTPPAAASAPTPAPAAPVAAPPTSAALVEAAAPPTATAPTTAARAVAPAATAAPLPVFQTFTVEPDPAFYSPEREQALAQPIDLSRAEDVLHKLQRTALAKNFNRPVSEQDAPDYHLVITSPMDLSTVGTKLTSGAYSTFKDFTRDVELIWSNAIRYNTKPGHNIPIEANKMREKSHRLFVDILTKTAADEAAELARKNLLPDSIIKRVMDLLTSVKSAAKHSASYFNPIESVVAGSWEDYKSRIAKPIDLNQVLARLKRNDYYSSLDDIYDDVRLAFDNAKTYYGKNSLYGVQAQFLLNDFEWRVKEFEGKIAKASGGAVGKGRPILPSLLTLKRGTTQGSQTPNPASGVSSGPATAPQPDSGATGGENTPAPMNLDTPMPSVSDQASHESGISQSSAASTKLSYPAASFATLPEPELTKCSYIIDKLILDKRFQPFVNPVDPSLYNLFDYFDRVSVPMDLNLVRRKLKFAYAIPDEFLEDVHRIADNALQYYDKVETMNDIKDAARTLKSTVDDFYQNYAAIRAQKAANRFGVAAAVPAATAAAVTPVAPSATVPAPVAAATPSPSVAPPRPAHIATNAPPMAATPAAAAPAPAVPSVATNPPAPAAASALPTTVAPPVVAGAPLPAPSGSSKEKPPGMSDEEWARLRAERKARKKAEKKERKRKEMEENVDIGNNTPMPAAGPLSPIRESFDSEQRPLKIPKLTITASSTPDFQSPSKRTAESAPAPPAAAVEKLAPARLVFKEGDRTAVKVVAPVLNAAARRKAVDAARSKQSHIAMPASAVFSVELPKVVPAGTDAMDIDSSHASLFPPAGASASAIAPPPSLTRTITAPMIIAPPAPPPQLPKLVIQRQFSALQDMTQVTEREERSKKAVKRKLKWKMWVEDLETAMQRLTDRAEARAASNRDQLEFEASNDEIMLHATLISESLIPQYLAQGFRADPHGVLVRLTHKVLPATHVFPFPIDQFTLCAVKPVAPELVLNPDATVFVDLRLSESTLLSQADENVLERWLQIKTTVDTSRGLEESSKEDGALQYAIGGTSTPSDDVEYFNSLAPSFTFQRQSLCYSHTAQIQGVSSAFRLAGDTDTSKVKKDENAMEDVEEVKVEPVPATKPTEVTYEDVLIAREVDELRKKQPLRLRHRIPFFGPLKGPCDIATCQATPIAGAKGLHFHRCSTRPPPSAPAADAASSTNTVPAASASLVSSVINGDVSQPSVLASTPLSLQAHLPSTALVLWSLPHSLSIHINQQEYQPAPFDGLGVWKLKESIQLDYKQREELLKDVTEQTKKRNAERQKLLELSGSL